MDHPFSGRCDGRRRVQSRELKCLNARLAHAPLKYRGLSCGCASAVLLSMQVSTVDTLPADELRMVGRSCRSHPELTVRLSPRLCYTRTHSAQDIAHASRSCYCSSLHRSCAHPPCSTSPWRFIRSTPTASLLQTLLPRCFSMVFSRSSSAAFWLGLSGLVVDFASVTAFTNDASDNVSHPSVRRCIDCSQSICSSLCKRIHPVQRIETDASVQLLGSGLIWGCGR